jgi:NAD(P)-dependent dehydrogenase (short-subunit alcohol dehydrogenase family)
MKFLNSLVGALVAIMLSSAVIADDAEPKPVLVTGASSGLGLRITQMLSEKGYLVYAGARKEEDLKRLDAMENVESVRLDVTNKSDIDAVVKLITEKGHGLYGLVNNAGVVLNGPLIEVPVEELEWLFAINVYGPYRITQAFAPLIIEDRGRIVNISSIAAFNAGAFNGHYSMSKSAVEAFSDSLAAELERFGVKVSVIEPGSFESNAGKSALERFNRENYLQQNSAYKSEMAYINSLLPKLGEGQQPDDVANAVMHALHSEMPKRRYLVANGKAAEKAIGNVMHRALQLNQGQAHTMNKEQLVEILDEQLKSLD